MSSHITATMERSPYRATGYQMLRSINIKNFRGFKDVTIDRCARINILVGENGSGKTALLEGLFLAAGASPEIAMRTRRWRGVESEQLSGPIEDIHRALFADLFHMFQTNRSVVISLKGVGKENRSVTVKFHPPGQQLGQSQGDLGDVAPEVQAHREQGADVHSDVQDQAVAMGVLRHLPAGAVDQLPSQHQVAGRTNRQELGDALDNCKNDDMKQRQGNVLTR